MTDTIYVLRGDVQEIWEYYVYGSFTNLDEAIFAAQELYDEANAEERKLMEDYSADKLLFTGLVISKTRPNELINNGDAGEGVFVDLKTGKIDISNLL